MAQLSDILLSSGSKNMIKEALQYIGQDETRVLELLNLIENKTDKRATRAAWVASWLYEQYPLIENHGEFLLSTFVSTPSESIRRSMGRVFAFSENIPEHLLVLLIDASYFFLMDRKQPIAVRGYCIQILENIAKKNPDLKEELRQTLLMLANDETSKGMKSKMRHQASGIRSQVEKYN